MLFGDSNIPKPIFPTTNTGRKSMLNFKPAQSQPQILLDRSNLINSFQQPDENQDSSDKTQSINDQNQINPTEITYSNTQNLPINQISATSSNTSIESLQNENASQTNSDSKQIESDTNNISTTFFRDEQAQNSSSMYSIISDSQCPPSIRSFENTFKRIFSHSLAEIRYSTARNIVTAIHPEVIDINPLVDRTIHDLITQIPDAIQDECIYQNPVSNINTDVFYSCNEQISQIEQQLADYHTSQEYEKAKTRQMLEKANKSLEACRQIFQDITQQSQEACQNYLKICKAQHEVQISKIKYLHRVLRSCKLRMAEFSTRTQNQMMELESVENSIEKAELYRQMQPQSQSSPRQNYSKRISNELRSIFDIIKDHNEGGLQKELAEVKTSLVQLTKQMSSEINSLSKETIRIQNPAPEPVVRFRKIQESPPIQKQTLSPEIIRRENARLHEETQRQLEENRRVLYEDDPIGYTLDNI
ncbi:hypothetical protein TVAG_426370 [Trichomonas vaginalis G3]|uniref:Uncharacterized protein n=1 Tax=Trichomonas vaginalis (strain ATCC PRA-98 / G3) TaxID=412133 RepID=A2DYQ4_TRIV3|nr:hypothetical protein TVAGG3_0850450 [Trichomonas vaginalis G3]EAY14444.1 hypothetical protein TVAG_426370 [Trichomonas vaginalis G3]KAI5499943.1 hypothetical protein TVAGG3_0850450 [Trichomonas vaginalis G3]|eukprot:XP_001326667.1 hypothetical protein [Trichomonas vaginalis G3]